MSPARDRQLRASSPRTSVPAIGRFRSFDGQRVVRRWRYRLAPDPLTREAERRYSVLGTRAPAGCGRGGSGRRLPLGARHTTSGAGRRAPARWRSSATSSRPPSSHPGTGSTTSSPSTTRSSCRPWRGRPACPFLPGNRIDMLNNGDCFYPAMLEAIAEAELSITIEAYIYWAGDIGRRFAERLAAKAAGWHPGQDPARRRRLDQHRRRDPRRSSSAGAASSPGTTRSASTAWGDSTTARTASR